MIIQDFVARYPGEITVELSSHTFHFVRSVMKRFAVAGFVMWLSGGWAEELRVLCPPQRHGDIDLLYPAADFCTLDERLASAEDLPLVYPKWFSHKRAVLCEQILVEIFLLEPQSRSHVTRFFDRRYEFTWPDDTLNYSSPVEDTVPVVSYQALHQYRESHHYVNAAYLVYLEAQNILSKD